ncbi:MAG: ABC transporter substrate-binding protein [Edaphobacter sp.]|uniref:ABC transporter substrate-binding protein n=1 Tax=Edaphobacter sp. TaxID=1934404 RepID=UPI002383F794|nr:ABC transporter substrate-binding protein [Edaphobacter sp.]MDE1178352.1 ABC transporter substrate-binding protein [Edaphobacter sp.]
MRIASLQPSVTLTLAALGALEHLCAHTKYCLDVLPDLSARNLPVLADSWTTTTDELAAVLPDLVIASVPYRMESLAAILKAGYPLLALAPHTLADVLKDTRLIAAQVGKTIEAEALIAAFESSLKDTASITGALPRQRVYCEEWGKPLIHSQPWIAELIAIAGGSFVGEPGKQTTAEAIAASDPDVLIFAWCGAGDRVPLQRVVEQRNWQQLRAVREGRVYCIPDEYLNTPAIPSLTLGLQYLSSAIHPGSTKRAERLISLAT